MRRGRMMPFDDGRFHLFEAGAFVTTGSDRAVGGQISVSTYLKLELLSPLAPIAALGGSISVSTYLKLELLSPLAPIAALGRQDQRFHLFEAGAFVTYTQSVHRSRRICVSTYLKLELLSHRVQDRAT